MEMTAPITEIDPPCPGSLALGAIWSRRHVTTVLSVRLRVSSRASPH